MTHPARILIVDDKEDVRESIRLILEDFGCTFLEAENGGKALELLAEHEFDVVFLDLKLPDKTGVEVLRAARGQHSILAKIIIVTGSPDAQTQAEAEELGAFRYLKKPLNYEEIRSVFAEAARDSPRKIMIPVEVVNVPFVADDKILRSDILSSESRPRILVLDDSQDWLDLIQEKLEKDFNLFRTTDVDEACQRVEREVFDLVILDMKLSGGISGLDVLNRMRHACVNLRAIILTGYPDLGSAFESGQRQAIAYISKQELASLTERVGSILSTQAHPVRVFLSYELTDRPKVLELYEELTSRGFVPWMDIKSILPGEKWEPAIRKAIETADYFVFCLTRKSQFREGVIRKEVRQALERQQGMLDESIFFITARLENCKVVAPFDEFQYVDLFEPDGFSKLLRALSSDRKN